MFSAAERIATGMTQPLCLCKGVGWGRIQPFFFHVAPNPIEVMQPMAFLAAPILFLPAPPPDGSAPKQTSSNTRESVHFYMDFL
mmetsp:Transcript_41956/g.70910  ORF Transcript_41956/g.70910 Transcript_41956/m.70910 type:complete len:84 (-) Transcript_41956:921-1172(-)